MTSTLTRHVDVTGYPHAVDALHRAVRPGEPVPAPTGHVAASVATLPSAQPMSLQRFGLAVTPPPGGGDRPPHPVPEDIAERFAVGLLDLHRAVLRRAFDQAVGHLNERTSEGASLLARQLVQAQLADIAMALREDEVMPPHRRCGDAAARWRTHQRLVRIGRTVLYLFGASGFLLDGPAGELHLAEVTGNLYLHPVALRPDQPTEDQNA